MARTLSVPHQDLQGGVFPPSMGPFQQWGNNYGEPRQRSLLKTRRMLSPSLFPTTHTHTRTHACMHAHTHTHTNKTKCTSLTSIPLYLLFLLESFANPSQPLIPPATAQCHLLCEDFTLLHPLGFFFRTLHKHLSQDVAVGSQALPTRLKLFEIKARILFIFVSQGIPSVQTYLKKEREEGRMDGKEGERKEGNGKERKGGWDGMGWDRMGWDRLGWDVKTRKGKQPIIAVSCCAIYMPGYSNILTTFSFFWRGKEDPGTLVTIQPFDSGSCDCCSTTRDFV